MLLLQRIPSTSGLVFYFAIKYGCIFNLQSNMVAFYRPESDWHLINGNNFGYLADKAIKHMWGEYCIALLSYFS